MEPLSILGAAAIGVAGFCAITDCGTPEPLPESPPAQHVNTVATPSLQQKTEVTTTSCSPHQTVILPPTPAATRIPKIIAPPPKVDVHIACPERNPPAPANITLNPTNIVSMAGLTEQKEMDRRPCQLKISGQLRGLAATLGMSLGGTECEKAENGKNKPPPLGLDLLILAAFLFLAALLPYLAGSRSNLFLARRPSEQE